MEALKAPKYSVLVIDDERDLLRSLARNLAIKYFVYMAESGAEGLDKLEEKRADCVLLDIRMPDRDGIEVLKDIRRYYPKIPVIIMTGHGDETIAINALKYGAVGLINKPLDIFNIFTEIERAIETASTRGLTDMPAEILLVDDEPELLESLCNFLEGLPYITRTAGSGPEALKIIEKHKIDILITDVRMPGMSGLELIDAAKKIQDSIQPVIITGHGDYELAIEALRRGTISYIRKPIDLEELRVTIEQGFNKVCLVQKLKLKNRELEFRRKILEKANTKINKQKAYTDNILRSMGDTLIVAGPRGTIREVNKAAEELLGYTKKELLGKELSIIFDNDGVLLGSRLIEKLIKYEDTEGIQKTELVYLSKYGRKIPVLFSASIMRDEDKAVQGIVCAAQDITDRKQMERERQDIEIKMLSSSKLASLGEIATGVAHEINQPLSFIRTVLFTVQEDFELGRLDVEDLKEKFTEATRQIVRISDIIQHLRSFGRSDETVMRQLDIKEVLNNTLLLLRERMRVRNIEFSSEVENGLPKILGNANQLEQVFINLFQNAIEAFEEGHSNNKIAVTIKKLENNDKIEIKFIDNGCGMPQEVMAKIFEPFYTTKPVGQGTGLGLSIAYGIIRSHNGELHCSSTINKGTEFLINIPVIK